MNALQKNNIVFSDSCPPLLKELFDIVIELDLISGEMALCKLNSNFSEFDYAYYDSLVSSFSTQKSDKNENTELFKLFNRIKTDDVDYFYRRFSADDKRDLKHYSEGYVIGVKNYCWICFNDSCLRYTLKNTELCDLKEVLQAVPVKEKADCDGLGQKEKNDYIVDLFFETFSYFNQIEKNEVKRKQAEGIRSARERGVHFGRQKKDIPAEFYPLYFRYKNGELSSRNCGDKLKISHSTFLKWVSETDSIQSEK